MSFQTLGLGPKLLQAVSELGYSTPTPIQLAAIPQVLEKRDLIGIAQTGTGKTAAFALPLLELMTQHPLQGARPRLLILAPTRELALQIDESVRTLSKHLRLRCVAIFGGVGERPQIDGLRRGADIIVATPGRLIDLMGSGHVNLRHISYLVLDEADRMLDMGFLPQIRRIVGSVPKQRQTLLFSATLSKEIEKVTAEMLVNPKIIEIGGRANPADTVAQFLYPVSKARKVELLIHMLRDQKLDSVLVFSRTKHGADKIARKLDAARIPTAALHSNRSQSQRIRALDAFKDGQVRVLVATDIAARGIDVQGISHVINFDFPMNPEDYVHRIGRTGRANAIGDAISFVTIEDGPYVHDLEKMIGKKIERRNVEGFNYGEEARSATSHASPAHTSRSQRPAAARPGAGRARAGAGRAGAGRSGAPRRRERTW
ncbi:MAG: DEAD/DEAH box helicase [Thermoanaerobaculia bacterium]|nr:DEAD/DEAH box helicase [Thermoanaerobaculia bacterium]